MPLNSAEEAALQSQRKMELMDAGGAPPVSRPLVRPDPPHIPSRDPPVLTLSHGLLCTQLMNHKTPNPKP